MSNEDFDDPLDDLIGGAPRERAPLPARTFTPAIERVFEERCAKCRGTGQWLSFSGRSGGPCFACKGTGKRTFKTSPEHRAKARTSVASRKQAERNSFREEHKAEIAWVGEQVRKQIDRMARPGCKIWRLPSELADGLAKYGSWTDGQVALIRKCMARDEERKAEHTTQKAARSTDLDASALQAAFDKANAKASRPGQMGVWTKPLTLRNGGKDDPAAIDVTFRMGSPGTQWAGKIFVRAGDKKLGVIVGGKFEPRFECTDAEKTAVLACSAEPAQAAIAYGKAWSVCSVCMRTLTNDGSIERGIGPICAERFGF